MPEVQKIEANNLDRAKLELAEIDGPTAEGFNFDVKKSEEHLVHAIVVKKRHDPKNERYITQAFTQQYNERTFPKMENTFGAIGYTACIILHDGRKHQENNPIIPSYDQIELRETIRKEEEAKAAAIIKEKTAEGVKKALKIQALNVDFETKQFENDLDQHNADQIAPFTVAQLDEAIAAEGIDGTNATNKNMKRNLLVMHGSEQQKELPGLKPTGGGGR